MELLRSLKGHIQHDRQHSLPARSLRSAVALGLSVLSLAALTAPAARAETILSGNYDGTGYVTYTDSSYVVTPSATFNNVPAGEAGLSVAGGAIPVPVLANIYGGSFDNNAYGLFADGNVISNIYGGFFENNTGGGSGVAAGDGAIVNIYGGTFANNAGRDLYNTGIPSDSTINLYGSDFTQNGVTLLYGTLLGDINTDLSFSGKLQNNTAVQTFAYRGNLVLAPSAAPTVPEPSSFALLGLALPALGLMVRRRVWKLEPCPARAIPGVDRSPR